MTTRTAKPGDIHNLTDWVKRWPKNDNLEFDSVTREPSVYKPLKRDDPGRTKITNETLRWKRNADVMTVLSKPTQFSPEVVESATSAYRKYHSDIKKIEFTNVDVLRQRETALLDTWAAYSASPSTSLMQDVLKAQKDFTEIERVLSEQTHQGRSVLSRDENKEYTSKYKPSEFTPYYRIYDPALPWSKRNVGKGTETTN
jgi:hypothetical protein